MPAFSMIAQWYAALRETDGYRAGLAQWFNPKYLPLMNEAGQRAWPEVEKIVARCRG